MTYQETLDYLFTQIPVFQKEGATAYKPGLDTIRQLDDWCINPHHNYPCVHVAGTNGKGSVSHLTASILQEAGHRTGLYTSPHLKDFRERIKVNGEQISEEYVISFVERFRKEMAEKVEPSFFELTTMMAFCWFAEKQVDIAVIEVGLGGRLDSTNIIQPVASVITNISFDHMALLGDTLEQIATEKAGIIKKDVPVIIGHASGNIRKVFETIASEHLAPIRFVEDSINVTCIRKGVYTLFTIYEDGIILHKGIPCALNGFYQSENFATVIVLIDLLSTHFHINTIAIRNGFRNVLKNTGLRGRWETLSEHPKIICDTGHNEGGIRFVTEQLQQTPHETLHFILGMVSDKDIRAILALLPKNAVYYFTKARIPRALSEEKLATMAALYGLSGTTYSTVKEALEAAKKNCRPNDLIFVGGSTFIVAEAI